MSDNIGDAVRKIVAEAVNERLTDDIIMNAVRRTIILELSVRPTVNNALDIEVRKLVGQEVAKILETKRDEIRAAIESNPEALNLAINKALIKNTMSFDELMGGAINKMLNS